MANTMQYGHLGTPYTKSSLATPSVTDCPRCPPPSLLSIHPATASVAASTASSGKGSSMTEKPLLLVDATC